MYNPQVYIIVSQHKKNRKLDSDHPGFHPLAVDCIDMFRFSITIFSLVLLLSSPSTSADTQTELLMFHDEYCGWCRQWDNDIGVIYSLTTEYCHAPLKVIDVSETLPKSITLSNPIDYTPTFVLTLQGQEVDRIVGYPGEDFFWYELNEMIENEIPENIRLDNARNCVNS